MIHLVVRTWDFRSIRRLLAHRRCANKKHHKNKRKVTVRFGSANINKVQNVARYTQLQCWRSCKNTISCTYVPLIASPTRSPSWWPLIVSSMPITCTSARSGEPQIFYSSKRVSYMNHTHESVVIIRFIRCILVVHHADQTSTGHILNWAKTSGVYFARVCVTIAKWCIYLPRSHDALPNSRLVNTLSDHSIENSLPANNADWTNN